MLHKGVGKGRRGRKWIKFDCNIGTYLGVYAEVAKMNIREKVKVVEGENASSL